MGCTPSREKEKKQFKAHTADPDEADLVVIRAAIVNRDVTRLESLLSESTAPLNTLDSTARTPSSRRSHTYPLGWALVPNSFEHGKPFSDTNAAIVRLLVRAGADVNGILFRSPRPNAALAPSAVMPADIGCFLAAAVGYPQAQTPPVPVCASPLEVALAHWPWDCAPIRLLLSLGADPSLLNAAALQRTRTDPSIRVALRSRPRRPLRPTALTECIDPRSLELMLAPARHLSAVSPAASPVTDSVGTGLDSVAGFVAIAQPTLSTANRFSLFASQTDLAGRPLLLSYLLAYLPPDLRSAPADVEPIEAAFPRQFARMMETVTVGRERALGLILAAVRAGAVDAIAEAGTRVRGGTPPPGTLDSGVGAGAGAPGALASDAVWVMPGAIEMDLADALALGLVANEDCCRDAYRRLAMPVNSILGPGKSTGAQDAALARPQHHPRHAGHPNNDHGVVAISLALETDELDICASPSGILDDDEGDFIVTQAEGYDPFSLISLGVAPNDPFQAVALMSADAGSASAPRKAQLSSSVGVDDDDDNGDEDQIAFSARWFGTEAVTNAGADAGRSYFAPTGAEPSSLHLLAGTEPAAAGAAPVRQFVRVCFPLPAVVAALCARWRHTQAAASAQWRMCYDLPALDPDEIDFESLLALRASHPVIALLPPVEDNTVVEHRLAAFRAQRDRSLTAAATSDPADPDAASARNERIASDELVSSPAPAEIVRKASALRRAYRSVRAAVAVRARSVRDTVRRLRRGGASAPRERRGLLAGSGGRTDVAIDARTIVGSDDSDGDDDEELMFLSASYPAQPDTAVDAAGVEVELAPLGAGRGTSPAADGADVAVSDSAGSAPAKPLLREQGVAGEVFGADLAELGATAAISAAVDAASVMVDGGNDTISNIDETGDDGDDDDFVSAQQLRERAEKRAARRQAEVERAETAAFVNAIVAEKAHPQGRAQ